MPCVADSKPRISSKIKSRSLDCSTIAILLSVPAVVFPRMKNHANTAIVITQSSKAIKATLLDFMGYLCVFKHYLYFDCHGQSSLSKKTQIWSNFSTRQQARCIWIIDAV